MNLRQRIKHVAAELHQAGIEDASLEAEYLLAAVLRRKRIELTLLQDDLTAAQEVVLAELLVKRLGRMPLSYVLQEQPFMDLSLQVNENVLIPRPETEWLVEQVEQRLTGYTAACIADIGTGSGNISIALARNPHVAKVHAVDRSAAALDVARRNAERNGATSIEWHHGDLLSPFHGTLKQFDFIVANLPYVKTGDIASLAAEVQCEPRVALDGGADGLDYISRLIATAPEHLKARGYLVLEIGADQGEAVNEVFARTSNWTETSVLQDLSGHPRMVISRKEVPIGSLHA